MLKKLIIGAALGAFMAGSTAAVAAPIRPAAVKVTPGVARVDAGSLIGVGANAPMGDSQALNGPIPLAAIIAALLAAGFLIYLIADDDNPVSPA